MNLGQLIKELEQLPPDFVVGFDRPHSWRGDYSELAFEPTPGATAARALASAKAAVGATFVGWKGGDYIMEEWTPVHIAERGTSGDTPLTAEHFRNMREVLDLHAMMRRLVETHGIDAVRDAAVAAAAGLKVA